MKFLKSRTGLIISAGLALVIVFLAVILTWSSERFTRISICQTCHEIYVDYAEYEPMGEASNSLEDYNPGKLFDSKAFDVTVGCAECHAYPYEEYRESPHYDNERGVRPGCVGCHAPHSVREILAWKFFYLNQGTLGESPFHAISNSLRDVPEWEKLRVKLAGRVRQQMLDDQSAKCKDCHKTDSEWFNGIERHQIMLKEGTKTCINCHYNLVHKDVDWDESFESQTLK